MSGEKAERERDRISSKLPAEQGAQGAEQGVRGGTQSQDPEITTQAKGRCLLTEPPRCPRLHCIYKAIWAVLETNMKHMYITF